MLCRKKSFDLWIWMMTSLQSAEAERLFSGQTGAAAARPGRA